LLYFVSLEILLASWIGLFERTHYIRENKGGFEFFHAISVKGLLVQGLDPKQANAGGVRHGCFIEISDDTISSQR